KRAYLVCIWRFFGQPPRPALSADNGGSGEFASESNALRAGGHVGTMLATPDIGYQPGDRMAQGELELIKVTKRYGDTVAVDAIDLKVPAGTYCCLLGPSGCGKSSTLRMIAGHEIASDGNILLSSQDITTLPPAARGTAMMFQSYALFPHLDLADNVAFSLKMKGMAKVERHTRALEMLRLMQMDAYATRRPSQLSGGQQQRAALARAMITDPKILLL